MSQENPVDRSTIPEHPHSACIEDIDDEDIIVWLPGPEPVGNVTIQHINELDPTPKLEPPVQLPPQPPVIMQEDNNTSNSDDDSLPSLGDLNTNSLGNDTTIYQPHWCSSLQTAH